MGKLQEIMGKLRKITGRKSWAEIMGKSLIKKTFFRWLRYRLRRITSKTGTGNYG